MRRMRSANSRAMRDRLAGPAQQDRVVVDAEQELAARGAHAQIVRPGLEPRRELVVLVAPDRGLDALDGEVGRLAGGQLRVDLHPRHDLGQLERRAAADGAQLDWKGEGWGKRVDLVG